MPRDGTITRNRILDSALELAMSKGLAAASLDQVIAGAGITKGAFFYHFKSKNELALELVKRFARQDHDLFVDATARVESLSRDPLQQVLLLCGLTAEMFKDSPDNPGCLIASYCYQEDLWSEDARRACETQFREWGDWIEGKLKQAAKAHPPAVPADLHELAEMFQAIFEGAFVLARTYNDPAIIARQVHAYRDLIEALFKGTPRPARRKAKSRK
ncbi:MAG: TetR/AcrR family transcriptional regulator [Planctomycetes bacterium]|nr:TetR/AcrR family transcriptional regulator [Planctomycetota bacterium]